MPLGVFGIAAQVRLVYSQAMEESHGTYVPVAYRIAAQD